MMIRIKRFLPILLLLLLIVSPARAVEFPQPKGMVNDFAGVMQPETVQQLEAVLTDLRNKTGAEEAVVTVKNMGGLDINSYAVDLFKQWGIGSKQNNDGVMLLLAVEERKVRIEVGYGLEGLITDARSGMILDQYVTPAFKQNDFNTGLSQGAIAIANLIAKDRGVTLSGAAPQSPPRAQPIRNADQGTGCGLPPLSLIIIVLIALFILSGGRGGCCALPGCLPGCLLGSLLGGGHHRRGPFDQYGGMGGFGGFGGGFGGGGGGFGGFGGGFSGGGGASRGF